MISSAVLFLLFGATTQGLQQPQLRDVGTTFVEIDSTAEVYGPDEEGTQSALRGSDDPRTGRDDDSEGDESQKIKSPVEAEQRTTTGYSKKYTNINFFGKWPYFLQIIQLSVVRG